jgi:hypothetical protein
MKETDEDEQRKEEALPLLYRQLESSRDKLMFILEPQIGKDKPHWFLVQVNLDETDLMAAK